MPWLRAQRRVARAEGHSEARAKLMAAVAGTILASREMPGLEAPLEPQELAGVTDEKVIDALLRCKDESDLRARLRALRHRAAYRSGPGI